MDFLQEIKVVIPLLLHVQLIRMLPLRFHYLLLALLHTSLKRHFGLQMADLEDS